MGLKKKFEPVVFSPIINSPEFFEMMNVLLVALMVPISLFVFYKLYRFYIAGRKANLKNINLKDKTILITGASDGIGVTTAEELAKLGATIIFACRNFTKTMPIIEKIQQETGNLNVTKIFKKKLNLTVGIFEA
jgi:NADPH:quinone reductase-like Zn-dependent oxidoreductase